MVAGRIDAQSVCYVCFSGPIVGVLGEYPYFYYYNFPQTGVVMEDSVLCTVIHDGQGVIPGNDEFVIHMHTDTPLQVQGLATGLCYAGTFVLYDSYRCAIGSVDVETSSFFWGVAVNDSINYKKLTVPGCNLPDSVSYSYKLNFFSKDSCQTVEGDFYIGYRPQHIDFISCIRESHPAPYHIVGPERIDVYDTGWTAPYITNQVVEIFPIIRPDCVSVDSLTAVSDSAGCISVDWGATARTDAMVYSVFRW